jgi:hypothetical protein
MNAIVTVSDPRIMECPTVTTSSVLFFEPSKYTWNNAVDYAAAERSRRHQRERGRFLHRHKGRHPKHGWPSRHRPR